jgi:hypothetical protein
VTAPAATEPLLDAARLCWPPPAVARVDRGDAAVRTAEQITLAEFLVVPSADRPRLLVPAGAPRAAAASVHRFSHALGWRERVIRTALMVALRSGALDTRAPDRLRVGVPPGLAPEVRSLQEHLAGLLGHDVVLSVGVGSPRANRKPVLQAISPSGTALAFVKLGDTAVTRELLAGEADALRRLADRPPPGIEVPRLLHTGTWNGVHLLVQSPLRTPVLPGARRSAAPVAAMRSLADTFDRGRLEVTRSPLWVDLAGAPALVRDGPRRDLFARVVATLAERLGGTELRHSAWHGDWTPWNLVRTRTTVRAWDWERFAEGVPVGLDALHYGASLRAGRQSWDAVLDQVTRDAARTTAVMGVPEAEARSVALVYLAELCRRYLLAAQPAVGLPLRSRADGLLIHLCRSVGVPAPTLPGWRTP